ncbi:hypothetical protein KUCAC02_028197, partial [Chaenocephalus aceratus]
DREADSQADRGRELPNEAVLLPGNSALNPNPLAKCKRAFTQEAFLQVLRLHLCVVEVHQLCVASQTTVCLLSASHVEEKGGSARGRGGIGTERWRQDEVRGKRIHPLGNNEREQLPAADSSPLLELYAHVMKNPQCDSSKSSPNSKSVQPTAQYEHQQRRTGSQPISTEMSEDGTGCFVTFQ